MQQFRRLWVVAVVLSALACVHAGQKNESHLADDVRSPLSNAYAQFRSPVGNRCVEVGKDGTCVLSKPAIVELVTRPELFHAKRVRVVGFVSLEFERNVICPAEVSDPAECLWLDLEGLSNPGFTKGRAIVEAIFDGENRGHLGAYPGALVSISRFKRL